MNRDQVIQAHQVLQAMHQTHFSDRKITENIWKHTRVRLDNLLPCTCFTVLKYTKIAHSGMHPLDHLLISVCITHYSNDLTLDNTFLFSLRCRAAIFSFW